MKDFIHRKKNNKKKNIIIEIITIRVMLFSKMLYNSHTAEMTCQ